MKFKAFANKAAISIRNSVNNRKGAVMWEYLLIIAVVCVIGAVLMSVIRGENGIQAIWQSLMTEMQSLIGGAGAGAGGGT